MKDENPEFSRFQVIYLVTINFDCDLFHRYHHITTAFNGFFNFIEVGFF